jgi:hypothetical protein
MATVELLPDARRGTRSTANDRRSSPEDGDGEVGGALEQATFSSPKRRPGCVGPRVASEVGLQSVEGVLPAHSGGELLGRLDRPRGHRQPEGLQAGSPAGGTTPY